MSTKYCFFLSLFFCLAIPITTFVYLFAHWPFLSKQEKKNSQSFVIMEKNAKFNPFLLGLNGQTKLYVTFRDISFVWVYCCEKNVQKNHVHFFWTQCTFGLPGVSVNNLTKKLRFATIFFAIGGNTTLFSFLTLKMS